MATLKCGSTTLPEPSTISSSDEIIWSKNAGRSSETGTMLGDVVAEKKTLDIKWEYITAKEAKTISNALIAGFFSLTFEDFGENVTITNYRGTIQKEHLGYIGDGNYYYKSLTVSVIQQ
jgi:hypothetical protein